MKLSPLDALHRKLGARLVPFAGWEMPVHYTGIMDEHKAVREACGVFDISHMGQFLITGNGAEVSLNRLLTNNVAKLKPGRAHYTFLLNEQGGNANKSLFSWRERTSLRQGLSIAGILIWLEIGRAHV